MDYSQKYTIVHFVTGLNDGEQFHMSEWPLHISLADTFAIARGATKIDSKLATFASEQKAMVVVATEMSTLGTTPVVLLADKSSGIKLGNFHELLISLLKENGAVFNNPEFINKGFIAHSTIQKSTRLKPGDEVCIDSLSLVDMFPDEDWQMRKVLATFRLQ